MRRLKYFICFSIISLGAFAQMNINDLELEEDQPTFLIREKTTGLVSYSHLITRHGYLASLIIHIPPNPFIFKKQNGFEFDLGKNFDRYFFKLQIQKMALLFSEVVESTNLYPVGSKTYDSTASFSSIGLSHGLRTYFFKNLLNASKSFETMSFGFSYDTFNETFSGDNFSGLGYQLALGLYTFSTKNIFYGLKVNYHMSNLRRPLQFTGETTSSRSITLSWLTLGLSISMYLD